MCCPALMAMYIQLAPNCKLPPKYHENSLLAVHENIEGGIFQGRWGIQPGVASMHWAGILRLQLSKWRDMATCPKKLDVIKKQAALHDLFLFFSRHICICAFLKHTQTCQYLVTYKFIMFHIYKNFHSNCCGHIVCVIKLIYYVFCIPLLLVATHL